MKRLCIWLLIVIFVGSMAVTGIGCKEEAAAVEEEAVAEEKAVEETIEEEAVEEGAAEEKPFDGVTLNVANMIDWGMTKPLWDKLSEFEENTGIEVVLNELAYQDLKDKQTLDLSSHTATFDVLLVPDDMFSVYSDNCTPIEDYLVSEGVDINEWSNNLTTNAKSVTFNGKIVYSPVFGMVTQSGYYRKDLFEDPEEKDAFQEQYGYALAAPKDMQQLLDIAKFFTRDDLYGLLIPGKWDHGACIFEQELWTSNLKYLDESGKCSWSKENKSAYDQVVKIAQYDQDLIFKDKVTPQDVVGMEFAEISELWLAGKGAMTLSWVHDIWGTVSSQDVIDTIGESVSFVFPRWIEGAPTWGGTWVWGINKDSEIQDAAWEFIKFITSNDVQKYACENTSAVFVPVMRDAANWAVEKNLIPKAFSEDINIEFFADYSFPELSQVRDVVRINHELLLSNQITPEEFAEITSTEINDILGK